MCPRMCDLSGHSLYVWELKEAQHQMVVGGDRAGKLRLIHPRVYSLDQNMFQDEEITLLHFDPNVKDSIFVSTATLPSATLAQESGRG